MNTLPDRILRKIAVDENGCWIWLGFIKPKGYGQAWYQGRDQMAHRVVWELLVGPIPDGLFVDHDGPNGCSVRRCVNPNHLCLVTARESNVSQPSGTKIASGGLRCQRGHDLTSERAFKVAKSGKRTCRECANETKRRWREENR
jgi:hypothetical protein